MKGSHPLFCLFSKDLFFIFFLSLLSLPLIIRKNKLDVINTIWTLKINTHKIFLNDYKNVYLIKKMYNIVYKILKIVKIPTTNYYYIINTISI